MIPARGTGRFPTTNWTLITRLRSGDPTEARGALDELVAQYRFPLYCSIRRRGLAHHDAEDALHDFLAKLLRLDAFAGVDAAKGRMRAFLAAALARFLINWREARSPRDREVSLESAAGTEARYLAEHIPDHETPERVFDRQWARALFERVYQRLGERYAAPARAAIYAAFRPVLLGGGTLRGHDAPAMAAALGLSEGALRVRLTRFLAEYRALFEEEVLQTVSGPDEVEEEVAYLMRIFDKD